MEPRDAFAGLARAAAELLAWLRAWAATILAGVVVALVAAVGWSAVVPGYGTAAPGWLAWIRTTGLADLGPQNLGGIVGCVAGGLLGAVAADLSGRRTMVIAILVVIAAWVAVSTWLFYGVRIDRIILGPGDPTAG